MVCKRCVFVAKQELEKMKLETKQVNLGEVELLKPANEKQLLTLDERLKEFGFEILDNQAQKLIETIKNLLIKKVQSGDSEEHFSIINYLSNSLHKDYSNITAKCTK